MGKASLRAWQGTGKAWPTLLAESDSVVFQIGRILSSICSPFTTRGRGATVGKWPANIKSISQNKTKRNKAERTYTCCSPPKARTGDPKIRLTKIMGSLNLFDACIKKDRGKEEKDSTWRHQKPKTNRHRPDSIRFDRSELTYHRSLQVLSFAHAAVSCAAQRRRQDLLECAPDGGNEI